MKKYLLGLVGILLLGSSVVYGVEIKTIEGVVTEIRTPGYGNGIFFKITNMPSSILELYVADATDTVFDGVSSTGTPDRLDNILKTLLYSKMKGATVKVGYCSLASMGMVTCNGGYIILK